MGGRFYDDFLAFCLFGIGLPYGQLLQKATRWLKINWEIIGSVEWICYCRIKIDTSKELECIKVFFGEIIGRRVVIRWRGGVFTFYKSWQE